MELNDIELGSKVTIGLSSEYYKDWKGEIAIVVGINYKNFDPNKRVEITIRDDNGMVFDGWHASELETPHTAVADGKTNQAFNSDKVGRSAKRLCPVCEELFDVKEASQE